VVVAQAPPVAWQPHVGRCRALRDSPDCGGGFVVKRIVGDQVDIVRHIASHQPSLPLDRLRVFVGERDQDVAAA
jgi:hypothetical protein